MNAKKDFQPGSILRSAAREVVVVVVRGDFSSGKDHDNSSSRVRLQVPSKQKE